MRSLILALLAGCVVPGTEQDLLHEVDCDYVRTDVAWDDAEIVGAAPADLLAPHEGAFTATGVWTVDSVAADVSGSIAAGAGSPVLLEAGPNATDPGLCGSSLQIPVAVALATADGALDFGYDAEWSIPYDGALEPALFSAGATLAPSANAGSYEADDLLEPNEALVAWTVAVGRDEAGLVAGSVAFEGQGEDDDVAWDRVEEVLTFAE